MVFARLTDVMSPAISSLRVYALNPRDRITPIVVLVLSLGPPVYEIVSIAEVLFARLSPDGPSV